MSDPRYPGQPPHGQPPYGQPPPWPASPPYPAQPDPWATPAGPPHPGQQGYHPGQVGFAGGWDASVYGGPPPPERSSPWPWVVLGSGALVVVILAVLGAVFLLGGRGGGSAPTEPSRSPVAGPSGQRSGGTPTPSVPPVPVPAKKAMPTFDGEGAKVVGRVEDPEAGLSYAKFGGPWKPMDRPWGDFTAGQEFVTERGSGGETWHATVFSGPLPEDVRAYCSGPGTLPNVAAAAAKRYAESYYPDEYQRTGIASQQVEIDGRQAYVIGFELTFDKPYPGMTVTKETAVIAAVDTGKEYPGVLYVSIPGTHYQLRPDINTVLDSAEVMGPKPTTGPSGQPTQPPTQAPMDGDSPEQDGCGAPKPSPSSKF